MSTSPANAPRDGLERGIVETPSFRALAGRALVYMDAGLPVHLSGPAGTGKTTLALYLAHRTGRPYLFIQGDEQITSVDLVRGGLNVRRLRVVDNYIRSVVRTADDYSERWSDGWLAVACKNGHTLIYDEFTRSRAEANNALLPVLEERVLVIPGVRGDLAHVPVHPDFRIILTSNPNEYVGVYRAPDALRDRLATIEVSHFDEETEVAIVRARSGIAAEDARRLVRLVRAVRSKVKKGGVVPSVRAAVILAQALAAAQLPADPSLADVAAFYQDVLGPSVASPAALAAFLTGTPGDENGA